MSRLKSVGILAAGTAASQLIAFAVAPLIGRLYTPADFGLFGVFISVIAIASVIVPLRLDLAVVVPGSDSEAAHVLGAGVLSTAVMTACSAALVLVAGGNLGRLPCEPDIVPLLTNLPLYLGSTGVFQTLTFWSTRTSHFARLSVAQLSRSIVVAGAQVTGGYLRSGPSGLALGQVVSTGILMVGATARTHGDVFTRRHSVDTIRKVFSRFRSFVVFGAPQALVNAINQRLPAFVLTLSFNASVAGHCLMAQRLLAASISLTRSVDATGSVLAP